jgi:hypothetical protein
MHRTQAVGDVLFSGLLPGLGGRLGSNNFGKLLDRIAKYSRDGVFTASEVSNTLKLAARLERKEAKESSRNQDSALLSVQRPVVLVQQYRS